MSDPDIFGQLRREVHEGGHSLWAYLPRAVFIPGDSVRIAGRWVCVFSSAPGNLGTRLPANQAQRFPLVGAIPGTPAAADSAQFMESG